jgi:hypothetical protein
VTFDADRAGRRPDRLRSNRMDWVAVARNLGERLAAIVVRAGVAALLLMAAAVIGPIFAAIAA